MFQQKKDADSDEKTDSDDKTGFIDVWNEAGDCGISFPKGETYVVYAIDDEESDHLETNVCLRTARLPDAADDLAYLHFFGRDAAKAGRLEGFVTSEVAELNQDRFHYTGRVKTRVSDVAVELKSAEGVRRAEPDAGGRFVFDGLAEGDYRVSVFERELPERVELLSGPKRVHVAAKGCATTTLLVLSRGLGH